MSVAEQRVELRPDVLLRAGTSFSLWKPISTTARYVEPVPPNDSTYSIAFARILMSAAAEVEVVASGLARQLDQAASAADHR